VTSSVHDETARIVQEQVQQLDTEIRALDTIVDRIQEQNNTEHAARERSFSALASMVQDSYANIGGSFTASFDRFEGVGTYVAEQTDGLRKNLLHLDKNGRIRTELAELRQRVEHDKLEEYLHTGQTPTRREYSYPTAVPRTSDRYQPMEPMRTGPAGDEPSSPSRHRSPSKTLVLAGNSGVSRKQMGSGSVVGLGTANGAASLRELDVNVMNKRTTESKIHDMELSGEDGASSKALARLPLLKRPAVTSASAESKVPSKKRALRSTMAASNSLTASSAMLVDRENLTVPNLSASVGHGEVYSLGGRLRNHDGSN
jgi:kinesin family protein 11